MSTHRRGTAVPQARKDRFIVTENEHWHFDDWYRSLDPELRILLEQKGSPTKEFLEKIWVSGFRAGYDAAPGEPMRIGPARIG